MKSEKSVAREKPGAATQNTQITNSSADQDVTVLTLPSIGRFVLFFTICFSISLLLVAWYLGYFDVTY